MQQIDLSVHASDGKNRCELILLAESMEIGLYRRIDVISNSLQRAASAALSAGIDSTPGTIKRSHLIPGNIFANNQRIQMPVFTVRRYASAVYAVVVCLCVCVCLSVCLSVTLRYCISSPFISL